MSGSNFDGPAVIDEGLEATGLSTLEVVAETRVDLVVNAIRDAVVRKIFAPGARLTEGSLARQLGVSKTPVREALLRLSASGLVEQDHMGRLRVVGASQARIRDAYEMRRLLETKATELAALRAEPSRLGPLYRACDQSESVAATGDLAAYLMVDTRFHCAVAALSGNRLLEQSIANVLDLVVALRLRDVPGVSTMTKCAAEHRVIAQAIEAHDAARSVEVMTRHIDGVAKNILGSLSG